MKGIVTVDDVVDVVREEATEDMQKVGGVEALDAPYLEIEMPRMIRKRVGWLCVLFLGEMLTASAMGFFEKEIARAVVLALFIPLIISSGGNSGSQATTLVIRAMALGEVRLRDWWRVIRREFLAGLGLGLVLALIGFVRIVVWEGLFHTYGPHYVGIAATVAISLVGVVLWGTLAGSMLPFILRRLGFDPASASAPFVATLVDVSGLVIYFTAAAVDPGGDVALTPSRPFARRAGPRAAVRCLLIVGSCNDEPPEVEPPNPVEIDESANTGCPPLPPISGLRRAAATRALLLDSVTPFRATGTNLYYLQQLLSYAQQDQDPQALQAVRRGAGRSGLPVAAGRAHLGLQRFEGHVVDPAQPGGGLPRGGPARARPGGVGGQAARHPRHPPAGQQLGRVRRPARLRGLGVGDVRRHATRTTTSSPTRR